MKCRAVVFAIVLVFVCSLGTQVQSGESADGADLTKEVQRLRAEVGTLRQRIDYLMNERGYDENDIDVLRQRVRHAEKVQSRIEALYCDGHRSSEQLHRCNAELRLALARLAFAKKDYNSATKQMDAAVAAWKKALVVLQNKLDAGTVTLEFLLAAQQSVTDTQLEKNRMRRKIQFLQTQRQ